MIGYQAIQKALADDWVIKRVFMYVDATPYVADQKGVPVGVIVITPDEQPESMRFDCLRGVIVHIEGADETRVKAFADRVNLFMPRKIILNWHTEMEIRG